MSISERVHTMIVDWQRAGGGDARMAVEIAVAAMDGGLTLQQVGDLIALCFCAGFLARCKEEAGELAQQELIAVAVRGHA